MNDSQDEFEKYSQEDGRDAFVVALETHACQNAWLIEFGASFHINSHQE
jgi:hypothetical protein